MSAKSLSVESNSNHTMAYIHTNSRWRFFDDSDISFTHIPKCSGTSFIIEMKPKYSHQNCYHAMRNHVINTMNVVFLRSPRKHVKSQFSECYYDSWGKTVTKNTNFPRTDNVTNDYYTWIDHFILQQKENIKGHEASFRCQDPRDTMARHLSCLWAPKPKANHALDPPPDYDEAVVNLYDADFVGLTDFYHESICMIRYRRERELPAGCTCEDNLETITHAHITHGVPQEQDTSRMPKHVQQKVDALVKIDTKLFLVALDRFIYDLEEVEQSSNAKILCDRSRLKLLHEEYQEI